MLKQAYRLKKNDDFKKIYAVGHSYATKSVVLFWKEQKDEAVRIGFSVSKKIGKAHQRNKIKRRMRACMRDQLENIADGNDLIFLARKPICGITYQQLQRDMIYLLKKSGIWKEESSEISMDQAAEEHFIKNDPILS